MSIEDKNNANQEGPATDEGTTDTQKDTLTMEDVQKMIQSETDKVRTEYSQRLKEAEKEKEELEKAKMTEDEQRQFELDKMAEELAGKEAAIRNRELTIKTVDLLKEENLPLEFREFVISTDEESTLDRVKAFGSLWNAALEEEVNKRFKDSGRVIGQGTKQTMTKEEIMNIQDNTKRIRAIQAHPELFR